MLTAPNLQLENAPAPIVNPPVRLNEPVNFEEPENAFALIAVAPS